MSKGFADPYGAPIVTKARPIDDPAHVQRVKEIIEGFQHVTSLGSDGIGPAESESDDPNPFGTPPTYRQFGEALGTLAHLYALKNARYGDSWCKRGPFEIFFNISRKFDRLQHVLLVLKEGAKQDEVLDLANYSAMQAAFYRRYRPGAFREWARNLFHLGVGL